MGRRAPIHPGEILRLEFLEEGDMNAYALAKAIHVPRSRITAILNGERAITAETALRLARFFGNSPDFWLKLQTRYELQAARDQHGKLIDRSVKPMKHSK